ncbi:MAG TPA: hypothetical protein VGQ36_04140 [Thermoanaerobaculia bacterium]|jgi:hypothetical protein|nr:hypothetical protein [Thermoanaerobaculia bacterium]
MSDAIRHGAYICLNAAARTADVPALADRLGLRNEFDLDPGPHTIAFLRRVSASAADIADDDLLHADAIVHVASDTADRVAQFFREMEAPRVLAGVVRPTNFTGNRMHDFAYAHQLLQQPGTVMPNAFLVPMSKTPEWWQKDWMERHTYFLPRYDDAGRMRHEGHALAAAAGIDCLMRRTYKSASEPAPAGDYDFITYFECANEAVATFHEVCASLRDIARNPEWKFVREGPTWQGRRVESWNELFD